MDNNTTKNTESSSHEHSADGLRLHCDWLVVWEQTPNNPSGYNGTSPYPDKEAAIAAANQMLLQLGEKPHLSEQDDAIIKWEAQSLNLFDSAPRQMYGSVRVVSLVQFELWAAPGNRRLQIENAAINGRKCVWWASAPESRWTPPEWGWLDWIDDGHLSSVWWYPHQPSDTAIKSSRHNRDFLVSSLS